MLPAASGLFFVRLKGVYSRNKYVMAFFASSWLVVLAIFLWTSLKNILRCSLAKELTCLRFRPFDSWGYIATAVYDTFVYLAISWQLAAMATVDRWQDRLKSFITGDGLGWLSKILLRSGQVYYL